MVDSSLALDFLAVKGHQVIARCDGGDVTSDAGVALVAAADAQLGLTAALAAAVSDPRQVAKVAHPLVELLRTRIYAIAQGYEDANDLDRLNGDPALKTACGRLPTSDGALASQPTLSRLENGLTAPDLLRLAWALADAVVAQLPADSPRVWLDVDATDDPCHGQQQFEAFNRYYDTHCYLPLLVYVTGADGVQRLLGGLLRGGRAGATVGLRTVLRWAVRAIRARCPQTEIVLRGDSAFGVANVLTWCEAQGIAYLLGVAQNPVLQRLSTPVQMDAALKHRWAGDGCREFGEFAYAAETWPGKRQVIVKVEVTRGDLNPRYVVTSLAAGTPEQIYTLYCARGDRENRIKEFKGNLASGRTSCHAFLANQARVLFHTAASVLLTGLRHALTGTIWATAQMGTLRTRLLKVGARIVESCRKVWWHLPTSFPAWDAWQHALARLC